MGGFNYCSNCGFKLKPRDKFCPNCGVKVGIADYSKIIDDKDFFLRYELKIDDLRKEYDSKVGNAIELVKKLFDSSEIKYMEFMSTINESNNVFYKNVEISLDIIRLSSKASVKIKEELDNKINLLTEIIGKLKNLIDEIIISLSDKDKSQVENLNKELNDLINSVKDY